MHCLTEVFFSLMRLCTLRGVEESLVEQDRVLHVSSQYLRLFCLVILGPQAAAEAEFLNNAD